MKASWPAGQRIAGAFDITQAIAHNQAAVTGSGPVAVTTAPPQWSYAAAFRLQPEALKDRRGADSLIIRIGVTVQEGRMGAVFVADDLRTVLSTTSERSQVDGETEIEVVAEPAPGSGWLILRNTVAAGKASACLVRSIDAFQGNGAPPSRIGSLIEVVSADSGGIDLRKLAAAAARARAESGLGSEMWEVLRQKWSEIPGLLDRRRTTDLASLPDAELAGLWTRIHEEATTGEGFSVRGWYQELYKDILRGKRVLDVGSGFGIDGLTFARHGARVTFVDIVESNLKVLERLCRILKIRDARFQYLENLHSLETLRDEFDVIWCQRSMINAPFSFIRREVEALLRHLPVGGRWIELAYPRERWERDGRMPFQEWGAVTDGAGTPWMEWYDLERLRARFRPAEFEIVLHFNFHCDDFNWFDLIRRT